MTEAQAGGEILSLLFGLVGLIVALALIGAIFEIRTLLRKILILLWANASKHPPGREFDGLRKIAPLLLLVALSSSCVSTTPEGGKVRVTNNPDVVKGCKFLGNVKATSGWGGSAGTGLAGSNTEKTLQNKTAKLGGNVLHVVASGIHASGEAYLCEVQQ